MIFYLDQANGLVRQDSDKVYQGSNDAYKIHVITPYGDSVLLKIGFILPNGGKIQSQPMYREIAQYGPNVDHPEQVVSMWGYTLPFNVTQDRGEVGVAVEVQKYQESEGGIYENVVATQTTFTSSFNVLYSIIPSVTLPTPAEGDWKQAMALLEKYYTYISAGGANFLDLGAHLPKYGDNDNAFRVTPEEKAKLFNNIPPIVKITKQDGQGGVPINVYRHDIIDGTAYYTSTLFYNDKKYWSVLEIDNATDMAILRYEEEPILPKIGDNDAKKVVQVNEQSNGFQFTPTKQIKKVFASPAVQIGFDKEVLGNEKVRIPSSFAVQQAIAVLEGLIESLDATKAAHDQVEVIENRLMGHIENTVRATTLRSVSVDMLVPNYVPNAQHVIAQCDNITGVDTENKSGILELLTITEHEYIQVWRTIEMGEPVTKTRAWDIDMWSTWR